MDEGFLYKIEKRDTTTQANIPSEDAVASDGTKVFTSAAAEYNWLSHNYPGYKIMRQSLVYNIDLDKDFDAITIMTSGGELRMINFEIPL